VIRAVFDANVVVASLPSKAGTLASLIDRWRGRAFQLVLSDYILDEIARAWTDPYWQTRLTPGEVEASLGLLHRQAEIVPVTIHVNGVASHAEDDMVIATALSANVEYLVSGDKDLQDLRAYGGVAIVSPRQFLAILDDEV
jgi:putative PIN family toxin of toxin-antitoxin system